MKFVQEISRRANRYYQQISRFGPMSFVNIVNLKRARMLEPERVRAFPSFIQVEVSTICNFKCEMCWLGLLHLNEVREKFDGRIRHMSLEEFQMIFRDIKYTECILLQGTGEPFMNPEIFDMIHYLREHKFPRIWVISNGSKITPEVNRNILDAKVWEICISLDGATAATYEEIRKGGEFETIVANLRGLVEEKRRRGVDYPQVALVFVALKTNIVELPDLIRLARDIGVDRVDVKEFSLPHPTLARLQLESGDRIHLKEAMALSKELGMRTLFYHRLMPEVMPASRQKCYWPWTSMVVTIDGHITPCWYNMFPSDTSMGNIFEQDFQSIWNGKKYREFRSGLSRGFRAKPQICQDCPGYS
jgi:radical SAM protein with 4Fe4S-binding SPASM domain